MTGLEIIKTHDSWNLYEMELSIDLLTSREILEIREWDDSENYVDIYEEECPLGTHFVDFLNCTIPARELNKRICDFFVGRNLKDLYLSEKPNEIIEVINFFADIKTMFLNKNILLLILVNQINVVINRMEQYLKNKDEIENKEEYWEKIDDAFVDFSSNLFLSDLNLSAFSKMTDFCLCDTDIEEYKELSVPQKIYIYSEHFDSPLLSFSASNLVSLFITKTFGNKKTHFKPKNITSTYIEDKNDPTVLSFAKRVSKLEVRLIQSIFIDDSFLSFSLNSFYNIVQGKVTINKCRNCGRFFIPTYKVNEIYCDNIFPSGKTCKQVGYENKLNSDEILKAYRTAYKTQNAKKLRNRHIPDIEERFKKWHMEAKNKLSDTQEGKMTLGDFKIWLKSDWWL